MTTDERIQQADVLLQEALRMLHANCRVNAKLAIIEALGHVQAIRGGMNSPRFPESPNHHHHHLTSPHVSVIVTHGWDN